MAARKTRAPKTRSDETRAFVVVLEEIRAQNRVFGEGQQVLQEQQARLHQQQEKLSQQQEQFSHQLEHLSHRQEELSQDMGRVHVVLLEQSAQLKAIRAAVDKKVDRDEVEAIVERVVARSR